jgi:hypothetical protein
MSNQSMKRGISMTDLPPVDQTPRDVEPADQGQSGLSLTRIFTVPLALFFVWLATVVVFTLLKQPGIVCMTPVAWLLATVVGRNLFRSSSGAPAGSLKKEAVLAGGVFGALMGLLYAVDVAVIGAADPQNPFFAAWSGVLCIVSGAGLCALIALGVVTLSLRRRRSSS